MVELSLAKDFSRTPGARKPEEGIYPGIDFRTEHLIPKLKEAIELKCRLLVDLDGVAGCGTSFLEEAFGGLIRNKDFTYEEVINTLEIKSEEYPPYKEEILSYIEDAHKNLL